MLYSWQKLSKNDALSLMDLVELKENSQLVILDSQNRKLYKSAEEGKIPVKYRIDAAIKNADKVTANLNAEILSELKVQNSEKGHTRIAASEDLSPIIIHIGEDWRGRAGLLVVDTKYCRETGIYKCCENIGRRHMLTLL